MRRSFTRCQAKPQAAANTLINGMPFSPEPRPGNEMAGGKLKVFGWFDPKYKPWTADIAEFWALRQTNWGVALVKFGDKFMGTRPRELLYRMRRVVPCEGIRARIRDNCFVAPSALLFGDVALGRKATVGYNSIVRGEQGAVNIGESACINDKAIVVGPANIGKWTTIDPMAVIDKADVASCSMVGAASIVMPGARIESNAMLCSASVLLAGATIPSGEIWSGNPAEKLGDLSDEEKAFIVKAAKHMVFLNVEHRATWELTFEEIQNYRIARETWAQWADQSWEFRSRPFYTRHGPRHSGRQTVSPLEMMQGRLDAAGVESMQPTTTYSN